MLGVNRHIDNPFKEQLRRHGVLESFDLHKNVSTLPCQKVQILDNKFNRYSGTQRMCFELTWYGAEHTTNISED